MQVLLWPLLRRPRLLGLLVRTSAALLDFTGQLVQPQPSERCQFFCPEVYAHNI